MRNLFDRRPPRVKPKRSTRRTPDDDAQDESALDPSVGLPSLTAPTAAADLDDLPPLEAPKDYVDEPEPATGNVAANDLDSADPADAALVDPLGQAEPIGRVGGRTSSRGQVRLARFQNAISIAERRRVRRLQKASVGGEPPPSVLPRNMPFRVYVSTRWFSALMAALLILVLVMFLSNSAFYVSEIFVGGSRYLAPPEIFQRSGLANMHVFWIDPQAVEAQLRLDPTIADAQVTVGWPPIMVEITITEREPALIWEQAGQRVWVDVRGRVMQQRQDVPGLLRVSVEKPAKIPGRAPCPLMGVDDVLGPGSCIDPDIIAGALQFKALYPNVTEIVYDPEKGLGFRDGRGWLLWFGDGRDIEVKMSVYNRIQEEFWVKKGVQFVEVNVGNPDLGIITYAPGSNAP